MSVVKCLRQFIYDLSLDVFAPLYSTIIHHVFSKLDMFCIQMEGYRCLSSPAKLE
jgi:hypothetical protein